MTKKSNKVRLTIIFCINARCNEIYLNDETNGEIVKGLGLLNRINSETVIIKLGGLNMRRKIMAAVMICTLLIGGNTIAVSAHGHGARAAKKTTKATVCSVKSCKKTSLHKHEGKSYKAHKNNDGHSYHNNHSGKTSHSGKKSHSRGHH